MTLSAGDAKGYLDHGFRAPPAYTAQLLISDTTLKTLDKKYYM